MGRYSHEDMDMGIDTGLMPNYYLDGLDDFGLIEPKEAEVRETRVSHPPVFHFPEYTPQVFSDVPACAETPDPDMFFADTGDIDRINAARGLCRACPVIIDCLEDAIKNKMPFGIWGGLDEKERQRLLNRSPNL